MLAHSRLMLNRDLPIDLKGVQQRFLQSPDGAVCILDDSGEFRQRILYLFVTRVCFILYLPQPTWKALNRLRAYLDQWTYNSKDSIMVPIY